MHVRWSLFPIAAVICITPGCRKSDTERAAEERAAFLKEIEGSSSSLTPYRFAKLVLRSADAPNRPKELDAIAAQMAKLEQLPERDLGTLETAETYARLAVILYEARKLLETSDEDSYPLLFAARMKDKPVSDWYDNGAEHLCIGALWMVLNAAPAGGKPMANPAVNAFAHYELTRAVPGAAWPPELALQVSLLRGLVFCTNEYNYAADEELTRYIEGFKGLRPEQLVSLEPGQREAALPLLLSAGHFLRAWNRMQMGRDEPATQDLEAALRLVENAAGENELTLWSSAFVAYQRGRYEEAAVKLEKLAQSPHLESETRGELLASAQKLRSSKGRPAIFEKGRSGLLIARALIARAGGPERLLARLVGEEPAHRVFGPMRLILRLQEGVARNGDPKALAGKAAGAGVSAYERLKQRLGLGSAEPKPAP